MSSTGLWSVRTQWSPAHSPGFPAITSPGLEAASLPLRQLLGGQELPGEPRLGGAHDHGQRVPPSPTAEPQGPAPDIASCCRTVVPVLEHYVRGHPGWVGAEPAGLVVPKDTHLSHKAYSGPSQPCPQHQAAGSLGTPL